MYSDFIKNEGQPVKKSIQEQFELIDKLSNYEDYYEKINQLKEEFNNINSKSSL